MNNVDFVFVILTYINSDDLTDFFASVKNNRLSAAFVVVDAYHDDNSSSKIKEISCLNHADYIKVPNKGYSYGNNIGISYAKNHYWFKYLIVSNPDIVVDSLSLDNLMGMENSVIGPKIINLKEKNQNPMYVSRNIAIQRMIYKGLRDDNKLLFYIGVGINKINRFLFLFLFLFNKNNIKTVYQLHGSFVIFGEGALKKFENVYDENIFLFAEESYLAIKLNSKNIKSIYNPKIIVKHKEDGSMKYRNDINEQLKIANIYVFEKYYKFK